MKFFKIFDKIFEILAPILFAVYGVTVLVLSGLDFSDNVMVIVLNICLIVSGFAKIADFIGGHKINHVFNFDITFGLISIALGIVGLARKLDLTTICLFWGIYEIVEASFEIQHLVVLVHNKEKIAIIRIVLCVIEIAFGILLCIHTEEEIQLHLIIVGVLFIISALADVFKTVNERKRKD